MPPRIPLDLYGEVIAPNGTRYKWDDNQDAGSRLINFSFRTKIGEGFSDSGGQLARRIDQDYPDLELGNSVVFTGADGSVAYEGYLAAMPRELADRHSIGVTLTGWMAHAKDRKFSHVFVDRDVSHWGSQPVEVRARLLGLGISLGDLSYAQDQGGLVVALPNQALGASTLSEAWYQAPPGAKIARVVYRGKTTSLPGGWTQSMYATDDRAAASSDAYPSTLDDTLRTTSIFTTPRSYVFHETYSNGSAATPAAGASLQFSKLAVYGDSGIATRAGDPAEPDGVYASDVMRWLAQNYCPLLDTSGIQSTTYAIQHLAFTDRTFPFDAFLELNKYHLWHLGVWEGKRLDFRPYDFTDYDWEIRTDDPGTTFSPQGESSADLFNGIVVTYTDLLTGVVKVITPETNSALRDTSPTNPWNLQGRAVWDEITLSTPTLDAQAAEIGRAALADRNRARTPGTITVRGYIRDRAGNQQPVWKVRAGDTIAITNFNDVIRLIVETDYDGDAKSIRLAIDKPFALLDAYLDRLGSAVGASGRG